MTTTRDYFYFLYHKYLGNNQLQTNPNATQIIVLVHGRNSCPVQFIDIQKHLLTKIEKQDQITLFPVFMSNGCSSVRDDCQSLYDQLSDFFGRQRIRELTIIGISKGGVTACCAGTVNDPIFPVKKIITISSPLKGTQLACFSSCPVTRKELNYQSKFVVDLERKLENRNIPIYHVVPKWDNIIIPVEATRYSQTPETMIYRYQGLAGHIGIQYDPLVIQQIGRWITNKID